MEYKVPDMLYGGVAKLSIYIKKEDCVMHDLNSIKSSLRNYRNRLSDKRAEKQRYLDIASDIGAVYKRMSDDKKTIKSYRKSVKKFRREKIDTFKGDLYKSYKKKMKELIDDYDLVISNLDTNMDRLNTVRKQYENKAYGCNGLIGSYQSHVNSLYRKVQNWVN